MQPLAGSSAEIHSVTPLRQHWGEAAEGSKSRQGRHERSPQRKLWEAIVMCGPSGGPVRQPCLPDRYASYVAKGDLTCSGRNPIPITRAGMRRRIGIRPSNLSGSGSD